MQILKSKLKKKGKGLKAGLKKKLHETSEMMKHAEEEIQKESVADVTSKLVTLRKTFEDKGWAVGKVYNDWATLMLMGLNAFTAVMALIVFGNTCAIAAKLKSECLNLMLSEPVSIGFVFSCLLLLVSVAGFIGVWFNRLGIVKLHFFTTALLALFLFCFTVYGFSVTFRGQGTKLPDGITFKLYNMTAYSKFLQKRVADGKKWDDIRTCITKGSFCQNWTMTTPEQIYSAKFSSTQLGCCAPPFVCGFAYQGGTTWKTPAFAEKDTDCHMWSNTELCYSCNACKAGLLQNVKSIWYKASVINMVVIAALGLILYRTWFVMRVAGRWESVAATVREAVKPTEEPEEEQSVIDIGQDINASENEIREEDEEELLVPAWLEEDVSEEDIPKSSKSSVDSARKKQRKQKKQPQPQPQQQRSFRQRREQSESEEEADQASTTSSARSQRKRINKQRRPNIPRDDDSWASPRQRASPVPAGFLIQNPLSTISPVMSPWLQSTPEAAYLQGTGTGAQFAQFTQFTDPNYGYLSPGQQQQQNYMQQQQAYYQTDPYGQQMVAYDPNVPGFMQPQDPTQMMYQDPQYQQQQMMYQDPQQQQQMYTQDPNQAYYNQGYDPNQVYIQDPSQGYDPNQGYNYMQQDQNQNQAAGYMQDPNQAYYNQNQWQNYPY